jgi:hypothetical protein
MSYCWLVVIAYILHKTSNVFPIIGRWKAQTLSNLVSLLPSLCVIASSFLVCALPNRVTVQKRCILHTFRPRMSMTVSQRSG